MKPSANYAKKYRLHSALLAVFLTLEVIIPDVMIILRLPSARFLRTGLILHFFVLCISLQSFAQPVISSFSPASGPVGTSVTITGANFSATPANNIVFIGGIKAAVTEATATALTVTVPAGAIFQPISATINGLTAYSGKPFIVTFSDAGNQFTDQSFEYGGRVDSVDSAIETTKYAIGDIDDDKRMDVITVDRLHHTMSVYRNTTIGGSISFAPKIDFTTGQSPRAVAIADIDGDGKPDVVVTNLSDHTVSVFKNTTSSGVISFAAKVDFATATQPAGISVTDVDKDGKPDLVINTINLEGHISVLRNTGSVGTVSFASRVDLQSAGGSIEEVRTADMDGDGKPDILLSAFGSHAVKIFRNTSSAGTISFAAAGSAVTYMNPDDIEIGDFNDDGKPDLAIGHFLNDRIWFYKNVSTVGNIALQFSSSYTGSALVDGLAIGDLDGDGKPDVAVNIDLSSFLLFKNISSAGGEITFNSSVPVPAPYTSQGICGDFDNDGKPDIASNTGIYRVTIWKNTAANPKIYSFSPSSGGIGETITIYGHNFTGATAVHFGGAPAASFTVENATTITAVIGAGATGDITVVTPSGAGKLSGFLFAGPPTISRFTPESAASFEEVTITGQNFTGTTSVKFGGIPATFFTITGPSTIKAYVGAGASGDVSVTNAYGTATRPGFMYVPRPHISSFSPVEAVTGTTVTIKGLNFSGTTSVSFGDHPAASFIVVDSTTIKAVVGNGSSGNVNVTSAYGIAEMAGFKYYLAPVITSFTPTEAAKGDVVTITGSNFWEDQSHIITSVQFGGSEAYSFKVIDSSTIEAVVYYSASGAVTLESRRGNASMGGFTFIAPPVISSFSPGIVGPGSEVTITGQNFTRTTAVMLGGIPASSFTIVSDDTIKAIAGAGASGFITITTPKHTVQGGWIDYTTAPLIYTISPTSGPVGTTVTISGINFQPGANNNTVYFGGVKADILSATADKVMVTVPPGTGYKPISVVSQTTWLTATAGDRFNVTFPLETAAFNDSSFAGKMDFATGSNPYGIEHADVDNDGRPDIIVIHKGSTFVSVYRNMSSPGRLSFSPRIDIEIGIYARALAVADVDADGKLDLIISNDVANGEFTPKIYIFRNQSTSENISFVNSLTIGGTYGIHYYAGDLATGDFDLDGRPDIVFLCTNCVGARIDVCRNTSSNGSISFAEPVNYNTPTDTHPYSATMAGLTVTDFNHDGKPDVIIGQDMSSALYFFKNTTLQPGAFMFFSGSMLDRYRDPGYSSLTPFMATLNSDHYPDLVSGPYILTNNFSTFSYVLRSYVFAVSVYDLNGDGKQDILGNDFLSEELSILKNTSNSDSTAFAPTHPMGVAPSNVAEVGDLDGDSKPEICLAYSPNTLTILRNRMGEQAPPEPTITSFSPPAAGYLSQVLIKGSNLDQATSVTFGDVPALYFTVISQDSILATVGTGASGSIRVTTPGGTDALDGFTFIPTPAITSFTPTEGLSGTVVSISGVNFTDASAVSFGGVPASSFIVESSDSIVAIIGNGASGSVHVTTPGGTAKLDRFAFFGQPVINDFTPKSSASGGQVTIHGYNFEGVASLSFGGVPASSFTVNSSRQEITATVGAGASGSVAVVNPAGTFSLPGFTFIYPAIITSFTPTVAGTGATVTIKGNFLSGATAVNFGGAAASSFIVVDSETITAVVDSGASGNVSVTTPAGTATLDGFIYGKITANDPDNAYEKYLSVNPNPTRDKVVIRHPLTVKNAKLLVVDILGREVKTILPAHHATQTETSVANLIPGMYIIIWSDGARKLSRVFIVQ